jgi:folate-binding protein YgfZ
MTHDPQVHAQVAAVRSGLGLWIDSDRTLIRVTGADAGNWLQTQVCNDVLALESGRGQANALLDRKAYLQANFTLHRFEDEYWILVDTSQADHLLATLDAHLFLEDAQMERSGNDVEHLWIQGPKTLPFLASLFDSSEVGVSELFPRQLYGFEPVELLGHEVLAFHLSSTGEDGYLLMTQAGEAAPLMDKIMTQSGAFQDCSVDSEAQNVLRIEFGIPRFGIDVDGTNRIPETTLEREAVNFEKGCYLGQEVVAKLRTYSSVKYALMGLVFEAGATLPDPGSDLYLGETKVGAMRSACFSPTLDRPIGLAFLDRDHRAPDTVLALRTTPDGPELSARVVVLPFHHAPSRESRAEILYNEALVHFERDLEDEDDTAITLLKEAILLHPSYEDAYEVLGVVLNRHHRVEEAIHYMKILAELNPDSIMAHTNLSVFYMTKGMIEEAEQEKAQSAVLQMQQTREAKKAEELAAEERARIQREAQDRIAMFQEVLEIDPDDPLATYGMGAAHMQLNDYETAIPHLERATQVQKDYSVAYLNLGKCHEFLGNTAKADAAYRAGIEVANRKGDLMPMREMERRLKALTDAAKTS